MPLSQPLLAPGRTLVARTRGQGHGAITRLMSPGDLGGIVKPFVFLDLFDNQGRAFPGFAMHPHSGIATLTYVAEGSVSYEDTNGARGLLEAGGVEWMRAGRGVWHAGGGGRPGRTRGFQLWIALPAELELGPSESLYQSADDIPQAGPARVLLGEHGGVRSAISSPAPITYLAVKLAAGETWRFDPPRGQTVLWTALGAGNVSVPERLKAGELAVFDTGDQTVEFTAETDAEFVLGAGAPHPHDLALGYYSVHTNPAALAAGEAQIEQIGEQLRRDGRL